MLLNNVTSGVTPSPGCKVTRADRGTWAKAHWQPPISHHNRIFVITAQFLAWTSLALHNLLDQGRLQVTERDNYWNFSSELTSLVGQDGRPAGAEQHWRHVTSSTWPLAAATLATAHHLSSVGLRIDIGQPWLPQWEHNSSHIIVLTPNTCSCDTNLFLQMGGCQKVEF